MDRNTRAARAFRKDGARPVESAQIKSYKSDLSAGWKIVDRRRLEKEFKFKDFAGALVFTNQVGKQAERLQHHPDIALGWGKVKLTLTTHKIRGLSENDFALAAKVDGIA
jgi:4a-hydroxytetrahydrobiopterin dehydratase